MRTRLAVRAISSAKILFTEQQSGEAIGSGDQAEPATLALAETIDALSREGRLVFEETLGFTDAQVSWSAEKTNSETLSLPELKLAYLNALLAAYDTIEFTASSNLSSGFSHGGFGHGGFGGSIDVTG